TSGYERAYATALPLKSATGEATAALVGSLCAVLFRYTQQETISLDLYARQPNSAPRRSAYLSCPVAADQPVSAVVAQAATALVALHEAVSEHSGDPRSNVAVTFVAAGDARANVLDDSDAYDAHFVVRAEPPGLEVAYNARLFEPGTIERLAGAVVRV